MQRNFNRRAYMLRGWEIRKGKQVRQDRVQESILGLVFLLIISSFSSCSMLGAGTGNGILSGTYTAEDADIRGANSDYQAMEANLQAEIDRVRTMHPGYDEYQFDLANINHNPYVLTSYLTVLISALIQNPDFEFCVGTTYRLTVYISVPGVAVLMICTIQPEDVVGRIQTTVGHHNNSADAIVTSCTVDDWQHMNFFRFVARKEVICQRDSRGVHQQSKFKDRILAMILFRTIFAVFLQKNITIIIDIIDIRF